MAESDLSDTSEYETVLPQSSDDEENYYEPMLPHHRIKSVSQSSLQGTSSPNQPSSDNSVKFRRPITAPKPSLNSIQGCRSEKVHSQKNESRTERLKKSLSVATPPPIRPKPVQRHSTSPSQIQHTTRLQPSPLSHETVNRVMTLAEFADKFSELLPRMIKVVNRVALGRDRALMLSSEEELIFHSIETREVIRVENPQSGQCFFFPLNSVIKFSPIYDNLESDVDPHSHFCTIAELLLCNPMPKVVCVNESYHSLSENLHFESNEILLIKEVVTTYHGQTSQIRELLMYSFSEKKDKIVSEVNKVLHFSTNPEFLRLSLSDILNHMHTSFPLPVQLIPESVSASKLPSHLFTNAMLLQGKMAEHVVTATKAEDVDRSLHEGTVLQFPVDLDISIEVVELSEEASRALRLQSENILRHLHSPTQSIKPLYVNIKFESVQEQAIIYAAVRPIRSSISAPTMIYEDLGSLGRKNESIDDTTYEAYEDAASFKQDCPPYVKMIHSEDQPQMTSEDPVLAITTDPALTPMPSSMLADSKEECLLMEKKKLTEKKCMSRSTNKPPVPIKPASLKREVKQHIHTISEAIRSTRMEHSVSSQRYTRQANSIASAHIATPSKAAVLKHTATMPSGLLPVKETQPKYQETPPPVPKSRHRSSMTLPSLHRDRPQLSPHNPQPRGFESRTLERNDSSVTSNVTELAALHDGSIMKFSQFVANYSNLLPLRIKVLQGVYMIHEGYQTDNRYSSSTNDEYNIHFLKYTTIVTFIGDANEKYSAPLNSSLKFSPLYDPTNDICKAVQGYIFDKVRDILSTDPMPKVVCVTREHRAGDANASVFKDEILAICKVSRVGMMRRRVLKVYSITSNTKKQLNEDCQGYFSTAPHLFPLFLPQITLCIPNPFQLRAIILEDSESTPTDPLPSDLQNKTVTLSHQSIEVSAIATMHWGERLPPPIGEQIPFEIPVSLDIPVSILNPSDDRDYENISCSTREIYTDFDPLRVRSYSEVLEFSSRSSVMYHRIRRGHEREGIELEQPSFKIPSQHSFHTHAQTSEEATSVVTEGRTSSSTVRKDHQPPSSQRQIRYDSEECMESTPTTQKLNTLESKLRSGDSLEQQPRDVNVDVVSQQRTATAAQPHRVKEISSQSSTSSITNESQPQDHLQRNIAQLQKFTQAQILELLGTLNLEQYQDTFSQEQIDGQVLVELCDEAVLEGELGMTKKLHRARLLQFITGQRSAISAIEEHHK